MTVLLFIAVIIGVLTVWWGLGVVILARPLVRRMSKEVPVMDNQYLRDWASHILYSSIHPKPVAGRPYFLPAEPFLRQQRADALTYARILAIIWPLALVYMAASHVGDKVAGRTPAEAEARIAELEKQMGVGQ